MGHESFGLQDGIKVDSLIRIRRVHMYDLTDFFLGNDSFVRGT